MTFIVTDFPDPRNLSALIRLRDEIRRELARQSWQTHADLLVVDRLRARLHDAEAAIASNESVELRHLGASS